MLLISSFVLRFQNYMSAQHAYLLLNSTDVDHPSLLSFFNFKISSETGRFVHEIQLCTQIMDGAAAEILGKSSAHSLATGPVMTEPFI